MSKIKQAAVFVATLIFTVPVALAIATSASANVAAPSAAATVPAATTTTAVSTSACKGLIKLLVNDTVLSAATRSQAAKVPTTGCTTKRTVHTRVVPVTGKILASGQWWCVGHWADTAWYAGPLWAYTFHQNTGLCFNGSQANRNWGPDCGISALPNIAEQTTMCTVLNDGQWHVQPAANFNVWVWSAPWIIPPQGRWVRADAYGNGWWSNQYGG